MKVTHQVCHASEFVCSHWALISLQRSSVAGVSHVDSPALTLGSRPAGQGVTCSLDSSS